MSGLADFAAKIDKEFGHVDREFGVKTWLSTGFLPLDEAISGKLIGGGMPVGRIVEIYGPSSCGKTAIATRVMTEAQKAGGFAMFMDHERSFEKVLAEQLGLNTTRGIFFHETPETFEESVTLALKTCKAAREGKVIDPAAPIVVVFDSLAAMVPKSKMAKEIDEQGMNDSLALAKATSSVFPALAIFAEKFNILVLVLNQMRLKPGIAYGDPMTTPGGEAPRYYASVRIQLGAKRIVEGTGDDKDMVGQEITAKCIKNKVARPFQKAKWEFRFREDGRGYFDTIGSTVAYLVENDKLESSGARITWTDGKSYYKKQLVEKIEREELQAELMGLLTK
ncbi:AAA family ATPase [Ferrovum sp.]|uniref:AAA family ATPase n=1 Tax=Ferrovum sp. TaxID=2609467 RepID=UPI002619B14E|nr:AAA family ATPase [Ferrovum sp.]